MLLKCCYVYNKIHVCLQTFLFIAEVHIKSVHYRKRAQGEKKRSHGRWAKVYGHSDGTVKKLLTGTSPPRMISVGRYRYYKPTGTGNYNRFGGPNPFQSHSPFGGASPSHGAYGGHGPFGGNKRAFNPFGSHSQFRG